LLSRSSVNIVSFPVDHYLDPATIAKLRPEPSVIEHETQQPKPEIESDDRLEPQ